MGCGASNTAGVNESNAPQAKPPAAAASKAADKPPAGARPPKAPAASNAKPPAGGNKLAAPAANGRGGSATSATSAASDTSRGTTESIEPVILERPASRGGLAFDISYDDPTRKPPPSRLKSMEKRQQQKKKKEMTIEELQKKMSAAEERKKGYEAKLKERLAAQDAHVEQVQRQKTQVQADDREEHLKDLRNQLGKK